MKEYASPKRPGKREGGEEERNMILARTVCEMIDVARDCSKCACYCTSNFLNSTGGFER